MSTTESTAPTESTALIDKSESLASKMNKITEKLTENLDISDDLELQGDDIIEHVEANTKEVELYNESITSEVICLETMTNDFKFIRETLKENTENGRRVLNVVTLDLLENEETDREALITSFSELNRSIADNMKLYIEAYKSISSTLLNINKLQDNIPSSKVDGAQNITAISTVDLIKELRKE